MDVTYLKIYVYIYICKYIYIYIYDDIWCYEHDPILLHFLQGKWCVKTHDMT